MKKMKNQSKKWIEWTVGVRKRLGEKKMKNQSKKWIEWAAGVRKRLGEKKIALGFYKSRKINEIVSYLRVTFQRSQTTINAQRLGSKFGLEDIKHITWSISNLCGTQSHKLSVWNTTHSNKKYFGISFSLQTPVWCAFWVYIISSFSSNSEISK